MPDRTVLTPDFKAAPLWWEDAPLRPAEAEMPARCDVAIVGSGYCGLAAARVLSGAGLDVIVLDAEDPGFGASTRNHGHVGGAGKLPPNLEARYGSDRARLIKDDAVRAAEHLRALIRDEALDVDYVQNGRFIGAHSRAAFQMLVRRAEAYRRDLALTVDVVPRESQRSEIGSDFYFGGITLAEGGALQPAKLYREMRRLAEEAGALIRGRCAVRAVRPSGPGHELVTDSGVLWARHAIVATNAYASPATPYLRRRLVPVTAYMAATEPLPIELAHELLPKNRTGGDTKRALFAFRRSPDGRRIVFAGRAKFSDVPEAQAARILHGFMCQVWPQLRPYRVSHCWKGRVGFTFDFMPHMGEHEGVHYAAGCQGAGVALMTYLGHQIGLKILGRQDRPVGFDGLPFPTLPGYDGRPWFLPLVGGYYNLRDHADRLASGRLP